MDLLEMRKEMDISLPAFGEHLGIDGSTVASIELGKRVRNATVKKIEKKLKRSLNREKFTDPQPRSASEKARIQAMRDQVNKSVLSDSISQSWENR